ncbi:hypothetical protein VE26_00485 [Devosia chinhatensis]|uniref:Gluconate 2-dehydrogenase subunit 3 family protein n=2 Tax=Devosia chinhatensis TaxID=429727 RepID=A0A0F5FIE8_9HYPH|nr:hypothetical protein VE26_00485 [Devosia chinhatensis]
MSRRLFLGALAGLFSLSTSASAQDGASDAGSEMISTLKAFADVIVPADETPSAGDLNVHLLLIEQTRDRENYPALLAQGTAWLNQEAQRLGGTSFAGLDEADQLVIVRSAFTSEPQTLARVFADFLRQDILRLYYGQQAAWGPMMSMPPQPLGYQDVHLPPKRSA